jgi:uncharacterized protein
LNTLQTILDENNSGPKFYLTGSSARKLKRASANLLPGRLFTYKMGPLSTAEQEFNLKSESLIYGTLPEVYLSSDPEFKRKLLLSYAGTYLKEEILAEALTKNLEGFSRFLGAVSENASNFLDISKLANQAQIDRSSAVRWFEILEDTQIVSRVESHSESHRKRLVQHPRYFFFDNGVLNALLGNFTESADRIGPMFENLIHTQLMATAQALDLEIKITNFRTAGGAEIDFVVENQGNLFAIECKGTKLSPRWENSGFRALEELENRNFQKIICYLGEVAMQQADVLILPWQQAIKRVFQSPHFT